MSHEHDEISPLREALTQGAVVVPRVGWGTLRVTGPDRVSWLNGIITCHVAEVTETRGAWGLLLSKQGKIEAELQVVADADSLLLGISGGEAHAVQETLERYLVMEDAEIEEVPSARWWQLYGPRAVETARGSAAGSVAGALAWGSMSWSARGSAALVGKVEQASAIEEALRAAGASITTPEAWEPERVRLGLVSYGIDFGPEDNPHAAGLERRAVSWTKGCYLGQEVVCMQDMRGKVKRRLARLERETAPESWLSGEPVHDAAGTEVGQVKSGAGRFAIASLRVPADQPGGRVVVGGVSAVVHALEAGADETP